MKIMDGHTQCAVNIPKDPSYIMSRRDWLAGMAMQGMVDAYLRLEVEDFNKEDLAIEAYNFADVMIKQGRTR